MDKFKNEINENLVTILPKTMKTGIKSIDEKNQGKKKKKKSKGIGGIIPGMKKQKNFTNYTKESPVLDLNVLYTGGHVKDSDEIHHSIIPSLLISF